MSVTHFIAKKLINYQSDKSFAFKMRKKRAERLMLLINECYNEYGEVKIIDIGGTKVYWKIIPEEFLIKNNVHITAVNLPSTPLSQNDDIFTFITGNGCDLSEITDNAFHLSHSNSVIEHVGSWDNMIAFSKESKRVAEKYYIQTPNYWFPIEPHFVTPFFHWLPKEIRIKLLQNFNLGWYKKAKSYQEAKSNVEGCSLLTKKRFKSLFPDAVLYKEKFGFFVKSLILIKR
ncbi:MAG: hypothetical protein Q8O62_06790 [Aequorivita sp.]|nr:hypothetical protein [Aequorivita sp.]